MPIEEEEEEPEAYQGSGLRFGELSKLTPVLIVISTIVSLYMEYVVLHCLRLLQLDLPPDLRDADDERRGYTELAVFHLFTGLLLYCLAKCFLTFPGTIPDGGAWDMRAGTAGAQRAPGALAGMPLVEKKSGGERRHCKWCQKYKPDRTHHCRVCNICVLRMDHHCPWVYNCIGFRNHKYFFLLVFYAEIDLLYISATMLESVWWATRTDVTLEMLFLLTLGEAYALFVSAAIGAFLIFHVWLMAKAMTTLELCEKQAKKVSGGFFGALTGSSSAYSQDPYSNICEVLGDNPLLWLLPCALPSGDGMTFARKEPAAPVTLG
jgi:hypothetical protein